MELGPEMRVRGTAKGAEEGKTLLWKGALGL